MSDSARSPMIAAIGQQGGQREEFELVDVEAGSQTSAKTAAKPAMSPAIDPSSVFPGLIGGRDLGPAERSADEVSRSVRREGGEHGDEHPVAVIVEITQTGRGARRGSLCTRRRRSPTASPGGPSERRPAARAAGRRRRSRAPGPRQLVEPLVRRSREEQDARASREGGQALAEQRGHRASQARMGARLYVCFRIGRSVELEYGQHQDDRRPRQRRERRR